LICRSNVVEHITSEYGTQKEVGISFAYYDYKKPELGDPSRIIAALIKQLCRKKDTVSADLLRFKHDSLRPSFESLQELFISVASSFQENFLMLDALDECPSDQRHQIIGFLHRILDRVPATKVFVTSRKEGDIAEAFECNGTPIIKIEAQSVAQDIKTFVSDEVKRLRQGYNGKKLYLRSDLLEEIIVRILSEKADGMYVKFADRNFMLTYAVKVPLGSASIGKLANSQQITK
jgi:hypothetical protein